MRLINTKLSVLSRERTRGTANRRRHQLATLQKDADPMYWPIALLILLTASVPQAKAEPPDEQALRLLNHYRQLAGLTLVKLDRKLSAGCGARELHAAKPRHRRDGWA